MINYNHNPIVWPYAKNLTPLDYIRIDMARLGMMAQKLARLIDEDPIKLLGIKPKVDWDRVDYEMHNRKDEEAVNNK